ncbi:MAG: rhodanese-like domain-containing protein, partial [Arenicellales bacterium]
MNTKCLSSLAIVAIFLVPAMTFASTVDAEKKVFAELTALIPQDRIVEIEDLHEKWKEVQKGKSDAIILDIRTGAEFHAGHLKDSNNIDSGNPYLVPKTWP